MDIEIIKGELDQLKSELQVTETAHKSLTGLLNMFNEQLLIRSVVKSLPTKEERNIEKINSFNRLKKEVPELDQVMYCTGFLSGFKWLEKEITK